MAIPVSLEALKGSLDGASMTAPWPRQLSALRALGDVGAFPALLAMLSCCSSRRKLASSTAASD